MLLATCVKGKCCRHCYSFFCMVLNARGCLFDGHNLARWRSLIPVAAPLEPLYRCVKCPIVISGVMWMQLHLLILQLHLLQLHLLQLHLLYRGSTLGVALVLGLSMCYYLLNLLSVQGRHATTMLS